AKVAGPVFKELADRLMSANPDPSVSPELKKDSAKFYYAGLTKNIKTVEETLNLTYIDSTKNGNWSRLYASNTQSVLNNQPITKQLVPDVKGMGLKDALYLLESMDLKVAVTGSGKVKTQSIEPGTALTKKQTINIQLN
ncbi:MAG TPA: PASTA domain-containing protein, partial [Puia sp.]